MRSNRYLGFLYIASTSLILVALTAYAAVSDDQAAIQWLRKHAVPLQTVEAGHGFTDLQPLGRMVENAHIVELGEATHGSREFFQLKHRLIEFLANQKGFTIFSIEANMGWPSHTIGPFIKVDTSSGRIRGGHSRVALAFKGIPYTGSVSGRNRFKTPPQVTPWTGVRDATLLSAPATQGQGTTFGEHEPARSEAVAVTGSSLTIVKPEF